MTCALQTGFLFLSHDRVRSLSSDSSAVCPLFDLHPLPGQWRDLVGGAEAEAVSEVSREHR